MIKRLISYFNNRTFDENFISLMKQKNIIASKEKHQWEFRFPQKISTRTNPSSDFSVFLQVFYHEQYLNIVSIAQLNNIKVNYILDLGANVGYTSIYFNQYFPDAKILAVEPDVNNFIQLSINTQDFRNIETINCAVWPYEASLTLKNYISDDWGKSFEETKDTNSNTVNAYSILQLQKMKDYSHIDIIKMDIEGAEQAIFEHEVDFLKQTKLIAIEIHDDLADRPKINQALRSQGFILSDIGELTIGINKNLL